MTEAQGVDLIALLEAVEGIATEVRFLVSAAAFGIAWLCGSFSWFLVLRTLQQRDVL